MQLCPAPADHGIRFLRTDVSDRDPWIAARYDRVIDTRLCTVVGNEDGVRVGTIEHLMAAFAGCEIDNAVIEIDAAEVPVMDGSSEPFRSEAHPSELQSLMRISYAVLCLKKK